MKSINEIAEEVIQKIDIVDVITKNGVEIKRKGVNYWGRCPFHDDEHPSFSVNVNKQICKCFVCGTGGNAISFLMKKKQILFIEAVKELAKDANVEFSIEKLTPEEEEIQKQKEALYYMYKEAASFYRAQLKENPEAEKYVQSRWSKEIIEQYNIGYAPDEWHPLYTYFENNFSFIETLEKSELFNIKQGNVSDYFRNRIMIPIYDRWGRVIAFSGRDFTKDKSSYPKYINSRTTLIYEKGNTLFGLHFAAKDIRKDDMVFLVEGNPDVIKLQQLGINNVVAQSGIVLTKNQINIIKRYTTNICILYDGDNAGGKGIERSGELIMQNGLNAFVLEIQPTEEGEKQDPDSFFHSKEQFDKYDEEKRIIFPVYYAKKRAEQCKKNAFKKSETIKEIVQLIAHKDTIEQNVLIGELSKVIPTKTEWKEALKENQQEKKEEEKYEEIRLTEVGRTPEQNKMLELYGFYIEKNSYWFRNSNEQEFVTRKSNCILEPYFHIYDTISSKRLYKVTNVNGEVKNLEFSQREMVSLSAFKERIEGLGNFLFYGRDPELTKLKIYLYANTKTYEIITQMGWQKEGFWAWGNGLVKNGEFFPVDEAGEVKLNETYYYIPAYASFSINDDTIYQFERKFKHTVGKMTIREFAIKIYDVYGDNGVVFFTYYLASLFRDMIVKHTRFFPILNVFGQKGTGKTAMINTFLKLFGEMKTEINMETSTIASIASYIEQTRNAMAHLDEYKNGIDIEKIELLKGLWGGVGRSRMNMEKGKKKETSVVETGIILSGQELPTDDIALFSRVIFLQVTKSTFTNEERKKFTELQELENEGFTNITNEIIKHRKYFLENYIENYNSATKEIEEIIDRRRIEDRTFQNWIVPLAAFRTLRNCIDLPFPYQNMLNLFANGITVQNKETKQNNELSTFWRIFEYLVRENILEENFDFRIKSCTKITIETEDKKTKELKLNARTQVLYMDKSRIFELYLEHGKRTNQKIIPLGSLMNYLIYSSEFFGEIKSFRFKPRTKNRQDFSEIAKSTPEEGEQVKPAFKRAMIFDADKLNLNIISEFVPRRYELDEEDEQPQESNQFPKLIENEDMPF